MSMIITWMEGTVLISNNDNDDNKWSWFYDEIALKNSEFRNSSRNIIKNTK
jgi:hypothetical protein